jgi:hypothetical protein
VELIVSGKKSKKRGGVEVIWERKENVERMRAMER